MILQVPPGSPAIVRDGAALLLALHVGGGTLGILSGVVALASPKGGAWHRFAGNVFLASMLAMGVIGAAVAPFLPQPQIANVAAGTLACYLVATGWLTVRAAPGGRRGAGVAAAVVAACISLAMAIVGLDAFASPGHELAGVPFEAPFAFSAIAALLAAADVSVIVRGGLSGAQRLARHLWRMNLGLLLAMVSALGQRRITHLVPTAYRTLPILLAPLGLVFAYMVYWLVRLALQRMRSARASRASKTAPDHGLAAQLAPSPSLPERGRLAA